MIWKTKLGLLSFEIYRFDLPIFRLVFNPIQYISKCANSFNNWNSIPNASRSIDFTHFSRNRRTTKPTNKRRMIIKCTHTHTRTHVHSNFSCLFASIRTEIWAIHIWDLRIFDSPSRAKKARCVYVKRYSHTRSVVALSIIRIGMW